MSEIKDINYLQMSYGLAEKAVGWASPNPYVGAVIVDNDVVVGHGYHEKPGKPHAEAIAIARAGSKARGSTAYITLEPCTHFGRTPPCLDQILRSGLKRVVVSDYDPNPMINKKGIEKIRQAGIEVSVGLLKERNRTLNEKYIKFIREKIPFVTLKAAVSLDGKTATPNLASQWISSAATREYIHLVRGEYDAIMVGINTILKDNPRLTVRHPNWARKKIIRIVVDSQLKFPLSARILKTLSRGKILVFTDKKASPEKTSLLRQQGVEVIPQNLNHSKLDLNQVLVWLGEHQISSVFVEGGGLLQTSFLENRLADKILVTISPKLIGGINAPTFFQGMGVKIVKDAIPIKRPKAIQIEDDLVIEGYI